MSAAKSTLAQLWAKADRPSVRAFLLSMVALSAALLLALYSGAAAELGRVGLASTSALIALAVAGWVGVTLVPVLAKRTPLRWIGYKMEYRISREGWIYFAGIILVALAALNTGNNLDRKSTRLNSSHANISYAVFCLKKKKTKRLKDYTTHND